jgi:ATP-binding cassette, subfamily B, bacterial
MLKRLYPYWRPARAETAAGLAVLLLAGALELFQPWPVKWLVDCVFGSQPAPRWMTSIWPNIARGDRAAGIAAVCLAILLLAAFHKLAQMISQLLLIRAGLKMVRHLRSRVSDHLHRLPLSYHDNAKIGDLVYRAAWDSYAAQSLLSQAVAPILTGVLILAGILFLMLRLDFTLTLIALCITPLFWLLIKSFGRAIERRSKRYHDQESAMYCTMQESLSSIRAIQAFTREKHIAERVDAEADRSMIFNQRLVFVQLAFTLCVGVAMAVGTAAIVYVGSRRVLQGRLSVGDVLVFLAYTGMLYTPISAFAQSSGVLQSARTQLARVFEILDVVPTISDNTHATIVPLTVKGRVEFKEVRFNYGRGPDVLCGLNATAEPGTIIAIVGRTGAGKTTLANLLLRFYDPTAGAVLLDGHDLRDLKLEWLRQHVSVVLQDAILFAGTIADNSAVGRAGASRAEIETAARRAQADAFIRALPDGYDTLLGERGVNLSGGQRQRIAIARAFLKDAPILILDEPTSALDAHTESALVAAMTSLMLGRTAFVIAHRLSTIRAADEIWVLDAGRIAERGTHEQLIQSDTLYRALYRTQQEEPEADELVASSSVEK